ncbi:MAG: M56 family metallopeptidase [Ruminococcus sp.]|nr:M56 family metallopeptidase [Ruminococcus sp.]
MTVQVFWDKGIQFLNLCTVYYAVQIIRCVLFSVIVFIVIFFLRKTVFENHVFIKGALWSMLIPVLFTGRMKFFYENRAGVKLFSWLTAICMNHLWVCRLYLCGVFLFAALLFHRRRKLKKMVTCMEKRKIDGTFIYVTDIPVTPSTVGVFRPKIVMPEAILKEYAQEEIRTILLHEKIHIRLGHLLFYFLWDILRALLWANPLLTTGMKFFREDMEEICDWVTIQSSRGKAFSYGQLLLKSMRVLQAESEDFNMYAAFAGDKEYENVRQRVTRIVRYRPYKRMASVGILGIAVLFVAGTILWTQKVSYGRYNPDECITVYDAETDKVLIQDSKALKEACYYDENDIYIESGALQELTRDSGISGENIYIYFGGFYKLPGIGGGGSYAYLETTDSGESIIKLKYIKQEDIFYRILKWI